MSYRPEVDLERAARSIVAARKRREWDPLLDRLDDWIPRLRGCRSREASVFRDRLTALRGLVGTVDGLARTLLEGGVVSRLGLKMLVKQASRRGSRRSSRRER